MLTGWNPKAHDASDTASEGHGPHAATIGVIPICRLSAGPNMPIRGDDRCTTDVPALFQVIVDEILQQHVGDLAKAMPEKLRELQRLWLIRRHEPLFPTALLAGHIDTENEVYKLGDDRSTSKTTSLHGKWRSHGIDNGAERTHTAACD